MAVYHRLRDFLRERIESGEWLPGHRLPTEEQLTAEFGVSRATVRHAIQLLVDTGLLERTPGRGTFVRKPKAPQSLLNLFAGRRTGNSVDIQVKQSKLIKPAYLVGSILDLPAGDDAYEVMSVIVVDDEPRMVVTSWLPAALFPDLLERVERPTMRRVLDEYYKGDRITQHKEIEVTILDGEEANLLEVRRGIPAFLFTTLSRLSDGRPFEYRRMVVRGDRYRFFLDIDFDQAELLNFGS